MKSVSGFTFKAISLKQPEEFCNSNTMNKCHYLFPIDEKETKPAYRTGRNQAKFKLLRQTEIWQVRPSQASQKFC